MYPFGRRTKEERCEGIGFVCAERGTASVWLVWLFSFILLVCSGIAYRVLANHLRLIVDTPIKLPVSLTAIPKRIGPWVGKDVPIPPNIQRAAGNDASLKRLYTNEAGNHWVNVYIAYTAHPRTMLGHRPRICYVAGGWVHDSTQADGITSDTGRVVPCLIHHFHRSALSNEKIVVLNFYIVNGLITTDESVFSGLGLRTPNISGDPARYAAQVQISSIMENTIRLAAQDMVELILDFFPDETGRVKAVEYFDLSREFTR